jgi:hypothetical protein
MIGHSKHIFGHGGNSVIDNGKIECLADYTSIFYTPVKE